MARRLRRTSVVLALLLGRASPSTAQVEAERWTFSAGFRQAFTNDLLLNGPEGPGDAISSARLSLSYARVRRPSFFAATGWVGGQVFSRFDAYDDVRFGLGLFGQTGLDQRRARLRYSASFSSGLNAEGLFANRIELPQVGTKLASGSTGFTYDFTPNTAGNLSLDLVGIRYRADLPVASARLPGDGLVPLDVLQPVRPGSRDQGLPLAPDGSLEVLGLLAAEGIQATRLDYWSWRVGTGLVHRLSPRTRIEAALGYRRTSASPGAFADGEQIEGTLGAWQGLDNTANVGLSYSYKDSRFGFQTRTHSFQTQVEKQFSQEFKTDLSLGASYLDSQEDRSSGWTLIGGAGFLVRLKRTTIAARYGRSRYQGVILGHSQETDQVFASLGHVLGKRVYLSGYGYYRNARDAQAPTYSYSDSVVGASLNVQIRKWGLVGVNYSYRRFDSGGLFPAVNASVFSLPFTCVTTWN